MNYIYFDFSLLFLSSSVAVVLNVWNGNKDDRWADTRTNEGREMNCLALELWQQLSSTQVWIIIFTIYFIVFFYFVSEIVHGEVHSSLFLTYFLIFASWLNLHKYANNNCRLVHPFRLNTLFSNLSFIWTLHGRYIYTLHDGHLCVSSARTTTFKCLHLYLLRLKQNIYRFLLQKLLHLSLTLIEDCRFENFEKKVHLYRRKEVGNDLNTVEV